MSRQPCTVGRRRALTGLAGAGFAAALPWPVAALEQRDKVFEVVGPYTLDFYRRHNSAYRTSASAHYFHSVQHDYLQLTPLADAAQKDEEWNQEYLEVLLRNRPRIEPTMEYYAPYIARTMWSLYLAIDWTHKHHEVTYDIMASRDVPWGDKKRWADRAVRYYTEMSRIPRSVAPLDVTMRRAGTMMKPYFTYFRNYYPLSNNMFYWAHWWHPVIYEAMMIAGNGDQEEAIRQIEEITSPVVLRDRPLRMLLSRESMPRYARMSPESANIFDNLHMLHGISYDILAYEGWTLEQKRAEMYRFLEAMAYRPGDEQLAGKFSIPYPDMDPRVYDDWMKGTEGAMNRIMREMLEEMMPMMMPQGMSAAMRERVMAQFEMKMRPGMQPGEVPGSLLDALKSIMPDMEVSPEAVEPGATPQAMIDTMLAGWRDKYGNMPSVRPMPMDREPSLPPLPGEAPTPSAGVARTGPSLAAR